MSAFLRTDELVAGQVAFSRSVGDGAGVLDVSIVDCSRGGLGLESKVYIPRSAKVRIRVPVDGGEIDLQARVQRATMQTRTPTYYIGVSFLGSGEGHDASVARVLTQAKAAQHKGAA